jgi:hypothetical protein
VTATPTPLVLLLFVMFALFLTPGVSIAFDVRYKKALSFSSSPYSVP